MRLKIREAILTTPIEVTTSSSIVADEEQFFFSQADNDDASDGKNLERKKQSQQNAKQLVATKTSIIKCWCGLQKCILKFLGQRHDEVLVTTDPQYKHYRVNEDCRFLTDGLLLTKNFGETGKVKFYQILIPKQLVKEVFRSLHPEVGKHPGITKIILANREKYHFPKIAHLISDWVMSCEQCIRESRIDRKLTRPPLTNPNQHTAAQEDALQIDLVPERSPSGDYEKIVTAMDVFSCFLFAWTFKSDAKTIAKVIINNMTKDAYLPATLISGQGSAIGSQVIKEASGLFGIYSKARHYKTRASNWDARTISRVNQTSVEYWNRWAKIIVA